MRTRVMCALTHPDTLTTLDSESTTPAGTWDNVSAALVLGARAGGHLCDLCDSVKQTFVLPNLIFTCICRYQGHVSAALVSGGVDVRGPPLQLMK